MTETSSSRMVRFKFGQVEAEMHRIQVGRQDGDTIRWFLTSERTLNELLKLRNDIRASQMTIPVALTRMISPTPETWELPTTIFFVNEQDEIRELLTSMESYLQSLGERMEQWPISIEGAVDQLLAQMSKRDKAVLRNATDDDLVMMHLSLGLWIRNRFSLGAGNKALLESCGAGKEIHPDDASSIIIKQARERLKKPTSR